MCLSRSGMLVLVIIAGLELLQACGPGAAPITPAPAGGSFTQAPPTVVAPPSSTALPPPTVAATATTTVPTIAVTPTGVPTVFATPLPGDAANGAKLFDSLPCSSCHDDTHPLPGGIVCPNLGNIAAEAARIVQSPDYHGNATDAAGYIRESIVNPNAYIVPGDNYHTADGQSAMEKDFAQRLSPSQIDDLVAYLMTKK